MIPSTFGLRVEDRRISHHGALAGMLATHLDARAVHDWKSLSISITIVKRYVKVSQGSRPFPRCMVSIWQMVVNPNLLFRFTAMLSKRGIVATTLYHKEMCCYTRLLTETLTPYVTFISAGRWNLTKTMDLSTSLPFCYTLQISKEKAPIIRRHWTARFW